VARKHLTAPAHFLCLLGFQKLILPPEAARVTQEILEMQAIPEGVLLVEKGVILFSAYVQVLAVRVMVEVVVLVMRVLLVVQAQQQRRFL
jgi:hypothetical protein